MFRANAQWNSEQQGCFDNRPLKLQIHWGIRHAELLRHSNEGQWTSERQRRLPKMLQGIVMGSRVPECSRHQTGLLSTHGSSWVHVVLLSLILLSKVLKSARCTCSSVLSLTIYHFQGSSLSIHSRELDNEHCQNQAYLARSPLYQGCTQLWQVAEVAASVHAES